MTTPFRHKRWKPARATVLARDGNLCQIRGANCETAANDADHIWSWRFGQRFWFDLNNLRASCKKCNRGRRTELVVADPNILPDGAAASPADIILADMTSGRIWLLDPGTRTLTQIGAGIAETTVKTGDDW